MVLGQACHSKKDLLIALNIATVGDQVWVKAGTYLPTHAPFANTAPAGNRDKTFMLKNGVKVYGEFSGNETLFTQRNWQANITAPVLLRLSAVLR
jgi:hypothetical protein